MINIPAPKSTTALIPLKTVVLDDFKSAVLGFEFSAAEALLKIGI